MSNLILIVGPTAVGKTALSIKLAQEFQTEIISADSRQFYKELEIGTAKPSVDELNLIQHHLINSHSFRELVDAGTYERLALDILNKLFLKYNVVVAVGGSGLYIQALCEGLDPVDLRDDDLRKKLSTWSLLELQTEVRHLDPDYFEEVDQQNPQRLMRAIEIMKLTDKTYSSLRTGNKKNRNFNIIKIGLNDDRETLYNRINSRVDEMIKDGLENEAKEFYQYKDFYTLQTVGYTEFFDFFDGKQSREEAIELIKRNSRRYAKRQLTWFRRDESITWFKYNDFEKIINHIKQNLSNAR